MAYKEMLYWLMAIPKPDKPTVLTLTPHATDVIAHHFREHEIYLAGEGQMISDWQVPRLNPQDSAVAVWP